jgi:TRAP-type C4-dicarboxylate transport system, small permease component
MYALLHTLNTLDAIISRTVRFICTVSMMIIFVLFLANVFVRFVPIYNFTTTDEWTQLFLVWTIFFGAQELARIKGHFVVDVITDKLQGTTLGSVFKVISSIIAILMFLAICYFGVMLVSRSQATAQTIPYMKVSYFYACIPVSAFFMTIYSIRDLVQALIEWREPKAE